jgi:hypothetical protein
MANPIKDIHNTVSELSQEQDPLKKLSLLEKSRESGLVSEEEYSKEKSKIKEEIKDFDQKKESAPKESQDEPKKSDKSLLYGALFIALLFAAVFSYVYFLKQEPLTIEDMHVLNLQGKLDEQQGYVYRGAYSFIKYGSDWYTQLVSPRGTKHYNLAMRYTPQDLENISISGTLDSGFFNNETEYYVTFNPTAPNLQYNVLAIADFNTHMTSIFEKTPIPACDRNESGPCETRPIVDCSTQDSVVFYIKDSNTTSVRYEGNCIVVEGDGFDVVRGTYRVLYNLYGIMPQ